MSFKGFSFLALTAILFKRGGRIFENLVEGHPKNISVKIF